jgi:hypothetical protein
MNIVCAKFFSGEEVFARSVSVSKAGLDGSMYHESEYHDVRVIVFQPSPQGMQCSFVPYVLVHPDIVLTQADWTSLVCLNLPVPSNLEKFYIKSTSSIQLV